MNKVTFHTADKSIPIKNRKYIKLLIQQLFFLEKCKLNKVAYIFCSDKYLLRLNRQHLNHHYYTDVLTFSFSLPKQPIEAEVYISTERTKENAKFFNVSYQNELLRVIIHAALHLCGYMDSSKALKEKMRKKENFYIHLYEPNSRET